MAVLSLFEIVPRTSFVSTRIASHCSESDRFAQRPDYINPSELACLRSNASTDAVFNLLAAMRSLLVKVLSFQALSGSLYDLPCINTDHPRLSTTI